MRVLGAESVGGGEVWAGVRSYSSKKEEERHRPLGLKYSNIKQYQQGATPCQVVNTTGSYFIFLPSVKIQWESHNIWLTPHHPCHQEYCWDHTTQLYLSQAHKYVWRNTLQRYSRNPNRRFISIKKRSKGRLTIENSNKVSQLTRNMRINQNSFLHISCVRNLFFNWWMQVIASNTMSSWDTALLKTITR